MDTKVDIHSETTPLVPKYNCSNGTRSDEKNPHHMLVPESIGFVGSIAISVNYLTGPAMLTLPETFQKSGLIPTITAIIVTCVLSICCSLSLANVLSKVPGNQNFDAKVEYSDIFRIFWGNKWFIFTHIIYYLFILCQNIASIVQTAQVVDVFLANFHHESQAIKMFPLPINKVAWNKSLCAPFEEDTCEPFDREENGYLVLSAGYIISAVFLLPICILDLKENTTFQIIAFMVLLVISIQFVAVFVLTGIDSSNLPLWGQSWRGLIGVVLFNFSLPIAVPAWLSEKNKDLSVSLVINISSCMASVLFILIGCLGALNMPHVSVNMLSSMILGDFGKSTEIGASIFSFFIIGMGIPLLCVFSRMNLMGSGLCNRRTANVLSVYLPWLISWLFYKGSAVEELLSWGGDLFTSVVAYLAPLLLAIHTAMDYDYEGSVKVWGGLVLTRKQEVICLSLLLSMVTFAVLISMLNYVIS